MGYYNKESYFYKNESAARRNKEQSNKATAAGMTEEQTDLIEELCALRHRFHCSLDKLTYDSTYDRIEHKLIDLNARLEAAGLPTIEQIPTGDDGYIDIDSIEELRELGEGPEDSSSDAFVDWYNTTYERIYHELAQLNKSIEAYLSGIDSKYDTTYCPTGIARARG